MKWFLLLLFGLIIFTPEANAGGGWTKKKGTAYYKFSHWWVNATKRYTFDGNTAASPQEGIFKTSIFAEYGVTDRFTTILNLPYSKSANDNESISGIGDTDLAFKYRISKDGSKFVLAGTLLFGIPLGEESGGNNGNLQTGDGEFNQMIRADISRSFSVIKGVGTYANLYGAFNNRSNGFSDEVRFGGELGASILKGKFWFIYRINVLESLQNGNETFEGQGATVFANNTEFFSYTYEAAYYISDKCGVSVAYGGAFSGKLIAAAPSYSVGVFLDIK